MRKTSHLPELTPAAVNEVLDEAFQASDRDIYYSTRDNILPLVIGNDRLAIWHHIDNDADLCYFDNNRYFAVHHDLFSDTVTIEIHYTDRAKPRMRRYVAQPPHNLLESQAVQDGTVEQDEVDNEMREYYQWALYNLTPDSCRFIANVSEKDRKVISELSATDAIRRYINGLSIHENIEVEEASSAFIKWLEDIRAVDIEAINRPRTYRLCIDHQEKIMKAPGSQHNHQAWPGGYMEHTRQVNTYATTLYNIMVANGTMANLPMDEQFSIGELLTVTTLHDIEKPFRYQYDENGMLVVNEQLRSKADREAFKAALMDRYGIVLSPLQQEALAHAEGIRDHEYRPDERVMSPMATIVHTADMLSARVSYSTVVESTNPH